MNTTAAHNALAAAADRQLYLLPTSHPGIEFRNNTGTIYDTTTVLDLADAGHLTYGPVATVPTAEGFRAGRRMTITDTGSALRRRNPQEG